MPNNSSTAQMNTNQSVARLLVILTVAAFLDELLVMFLLELFPPMPKVASYLLDAALMSALLFPVFYFLVFRPMSRNIAELRQTGENLRTLSVVFESKDPIMITDAQANILRANKRFQHLSGYSAEELIGRNPRIFNSERYSDTYYKKMWSQIVRTGFWSGETRLRDKRGYETPVGVVITAVKNEQQETTHYVAIYN